MVQKKETTSKTFFALDQKLTKMGPKLKKN